MIYRFVAHLPNDAVCSEHYEFPYKFGKAFLYVYEPGIIFGNVGWYRRCHPLDCYLSKYLSSVDYYSVKL